MTVMITGGAGFIGSHLADTLLEVGHDIRVVDDLRSNAVHPNIWKDQTLDFYKMTVEEYYENRSAWRPCKLTEIYHLASPVGPAGILPYAGEIIREIVDSTYAAISLALQHECRLVYVSTSEVYNGGENGLCRESTPCIVPLDNPSARLEYAIGKMAGEMAVMNTKGLDAVIIRPFNVAGPRQSVKGGFVLPRFCQQALSHSPLTVFGDGSQIRAFTHVQDIVYGLILAMRFGTKGVYNLGNPYNKTTIFDLAKSVADIVGGKQDIQFTDGKRVYGPEYREAADKYPDASRAMSELGWSPSRSIEKTIQDTLAYEQRHLEYNI